MSDEFPYPECDDCLLFVDEDCKGVTRWILCKYLVREFIESFKVPMPKMGKCPSTLAVKPIKEEHMFKIIMERNDSRGRRILIETEIGYSKTNIKDAYKEIEEIMESWEKGDKGDSQDKPKKED